MSTSFVVSFCIFAMSLVIGGAFDEVAYGQTPSNPKNLTSTALDHTKIRLDWGDGSSTNGYRVSYRTGSYPSSSCSNGTIVNLGDVLTYTVTGLSPSTTYYFRVCGKYNSKISSGVTTARATLAVPVPGNPSNLAVTAASQTQVNLTWVDGASTTGFKVAYQTGSSPSSQCTNGTVVTLGDVQAHSITGLTAGTTYYVRVCAFNEYSTSSGTAGSVATPAAPTNTLMWSKVLSTCPYGTACQFHDCSIDSSGNIYAVGEDWANGHDIIVKKYDEAGTEITSGWNLRIGDATGKDMSRAVEVDSSDSVYVGGILYNGVSPTSEEDFLVRKYSSDGILIWQYTSDYETKEDIRGMALGSGGVYLYAVGSVGVDPNQDDSKYAILKIRTSDGALVESNLGMTCAPGQRSRWNDVVVDRTGDPDTDIIYAVGVGDNCLSPTSTNDGVVHQLNTSLQVQSGWPKVLGTEDYNTLVRAQIGNDGSLYVAGRWSTAGNWDMMMTKFSPAGVEDTTNWHKQVDFGGIDNAEAIVAHPNGSVYFAGCSATSPSLKTDWRIKKFEAGGVEQTQLWDVIRDVNNLQTEDRLEGSCVDPRNGQIVFAGYTMMQTTGSYRSALEKYAP